MRSRKWRPLSPRTTSVLCRGFHFYHVLLSIFLLSSLSCALLSLDNSFEVSSNYPWRAKSKIQVIRKGKRIKISYLLGLREIRERDILFYSRRYYFHKRYEEIQTSQPTGRA